MRKVFLLALILSACVIWTPVHAEEDIPVLVGTWETVSCVVSHPRKGFSESSVTIVIDEQKGRAFQGYLQFKSEEGLPGKEFVGHISSDNKKLYGSYKRGTLTGEILSEDEMQLYLLKHGKEYKSLDLELKRVK